MQAIGRSRGRWTTKIHALTDVIGRLYALMLKAGDVSDLKAAPALIERAGRMRYLLADKGYDADRLPVRSVKLEPFLSFPDGETANAPPAMTRTGTAADT
ncbi:transposase [Sphingomonas sanguinis]|uniref:transposase n=1 Tax=Sphingomonas sanguinis TaxID=33051 RepID=UPI001C55DDD9|nr:transposase [Sphingomonas sanguinis]